jgi:aspartate-semialdehyde dehydrogenase
MPHSSPKKLYNVAVVGATGVVGQEFLRILAQRHFPLRSLRLFASKRSAGKRIMFGENDIEIQEPTAKAFAGADIVFVSATDDVSRQIPPIAAKAGAVVIDDSGVWRMNPEVPLVVPEVNPEDVTKHNGILAIPNCSTTPLVMTLWPLHRVNPIKRVVVATYQSVSGTGREAVKELTEQTRKMLENQKSAPHVYPHPIAYNLLPEIGSFKDDGYTSEEWKMTAESRKIMHEPELPLSATCVRVPVYVAHSAAVHVELSRQMEPEEAAHLLRDAPGVVVQDDPSISLYPQPRTAAGRDEVFVGRLRHDSSHPRGLAYWVVCDNLRKGAALNALQIAEELVCRALI